MKVMVNGVRLFFDVEGAGWVPQGARLAKRATLLLLHGGPGADHSIYKPRFSAFADIAQVVYLDHRGNGRSDAGPQQQWTMAQWADDVYDFCRTLEIERPVVYGASFGGMVAMSYALRHPGHAAALVLDSTAASITRHAEAKVAMFRRLGGEAAAALAERRFVHGDTSAAVLREWLRVAVPLYTQRPRDVGAEQRMVSNPACTAWFNRPDGEGRRMDWLPQLGRIVAPTLVLGGRLDPMLPIENQREIAAALPAQLLRYAEFEDCGHGTLHDAPEPAGALLRDFIAEHG